MLKTIKETDRVTFVYSEKTVPTILVLVGVLGLGAGMSIMNSVTIETLIGLLLGPLVAFLASYIMFKQKQILLVDGARNTVEEHIGKKRIVFNFDEIKYADVERVREEDVHLTPEPVKTEQEVLQEEHDPTHEQESPLDVTREHTKAAKLHLNYHPYLLLKKDDEKYFFLDNKERGLPNYKTAKAVVEAINEYVGVAKVTAEKLNLYRIDKKNNSGVLSLLIILLLLGAGAYFVMKSQL